MAKKEKDGLSLSDILEKYGVDRPTEFIDSGVDALNELWGGGVPLGYAATLWSAPGAGKSTISAQVARSFCRQGYKVAIIDTERAWNDSQITAFGLAQFKLDGLLVHLTVRDYGQLEDVCKVLSDNGSFRLVIIDSMSEVAAYSDKNLSVRDCRPGVKALQEANLLPAIKNWFADANISSLWLFHARANLQMGMPNPYAPKERQAGGFAAQHVPDIITKLSVGTKLKDDPSSETSNPDEIFGVELYMETTKNKFCKPFVRKKVKLVFGRGVDKRYAVIDMALESGVIRKSGVSYFMPWADEKYVGQKKLYGMPKESVSRLYEFMRTGGSSESVAGYYPTPSDISSPEIPVDSDGVIQEP